VTATPLSRARVLDDVAEQGALARRRRPSGDLARLHRPIYPSGRVYVALTVVAVVGWAAALVLPGVVDLVETVDRALIDTILANRWGPLVRGAEELQVLADSWGWRLLHWGTLAAGLAFARFRHVAVFVALLLVVTALTTVAVERGGGLLPGSGPLSPQEFTQPSPPIVHLGLAVVGLMYVLVPRGRMRNRAKLVATAVMAPLVASRLYLGLDDPSNVVVSLVLGMALPVLGFRFLVPNEAFPIAYGKGRKRTLTAQQVAAIETAAATYLGWRVREVRALRPPGSAGSTPLLLRLDPRVGDAPAEVFAKLYSLAHLRADRWYKLGRAIRYGRLEDEAPFGSVRQLVEHEDYLVRVADAGGLPVPRSYGILELAEGREELLLLEMLPDSTQLGDVAVTVDLVDQGLEIIARLWAAGVAHRDVKPANLVVSQGRLYLVDLSFAEVAATPWRQAVDLANMLLCLGLYADPELVYERSLRWFRPDEVGEAFATTSSVTIPAQLRRLLRERRPDLPERFRALAPFHPPIAVQRWSLARAALTVAVVVAALLAVGLLAFNLETVGLL
jgi:tRNA A-37 threonylcarbamoyl transferase component Bud32